MLPRPSRTSLGPRLAVWLRRSSPPRLLGLSRPLPSGVAAKKEDEGPATRKPLLSDDCCTCYACNISVPYKEMMGQHMMSEGHIHSVAVFYGLKPP